MDKKIEQLGLAAKLVSESTFHRNKPPIFVFNSIIIPAIEHGNIHFAFSGKGNPIAFWIWAHLTPDVERRLFKNPNDVLHISEWNEGENLCLIDFCAPHGHLNDIIYYMKTEMFSGYNRAYSIRLARYGGVRKISVWKRSTSSQKTYRDSSRCLPYTAFASTLTEYQSRLTY